MEAHSVLTTEIGKKVQLIIADLAAIDLIELEGDTSLHDLHLTGSPVLRAALEHAFQCEIPDYDVARMTTLERAATYVEANMRLV